MRRAIPILTATALAVLSLPSHAAPRVYEVELVLALDDFDAGLTSVETLLAERGALLVSREVEESADGRIAYLDYRLPAETSRRTVSELRGLGVVESETSRLDVVGDLLAELNAQVERLEGRVASASVAVEQSGLTADERIRRQRQLSTLEGELEDTRRRLDELSDAAERHSLELVLTPRPDPAFGPAARFIFTTVVPALVIVILAFFIGLRIGRLRERKGE